MSHKNRHPRAPAKPPHASPQMQRGLSTRRSMQMLAREESAHFSQEFDQRIEETIVPEDQEKLTPAELKEEHQKILKAQDPNADRSVAMFDFREREFRRSTAVIDHMVVHFSMDGVLLPANNEQDEHRSTADAGVDAGSGGSDRTDEEKEKASGAAPARSTKTLKNQFNFSERASQTFNNALRERSVMTEPPPHSDYTFNVTQWEIFDAYLEQVVQTLAEKREKDAAKNQSRRSGKAGQDEELAVIPERKQDPLSALLNSDKMKKSLKVMERMINQNAEAEVFHEYKYKVTHDSVPTDGFLKLWNFTHKEQPKNGKQKSSSNATKRAVTCLSWNTQYKDLFAVAYGSYDFPQKKNEQGLICCFTLKNTSYPEYIYNTTSGVMCLDWHPQYASLLAVGLYDGTVCVYDVQHHGGEPIYISNDPKTKHTDPVWEVHWQAQDSSNKSINFFSVSSDGRVTNWVVRKNELINEEVQELRLSDRPGAGISAVDGKPADAKELDREEEEATLVGLAGGTCMDFNALHPHLFVVGTEEGKIQSYSKAYSNQCLHSYAGHHMMVYAVRWNPFHPRVFLSCSADWTVKLWEQNTTEPIMTFDLGDSVADIAWAPYSSTVFGVVTSGGVVCVYDLLSKNKHEPRGKRMVSRSKDKKAVLTHIRFSTTEPVILVGDDHGQVSCFKLSADLYENTMALVKKQKGKKTKDEGSLDVRENIHRIDELLRLADAVVSVPESSVAAVDTAGAGAARLGGSKAASRVQSAAGDRAAM